MPQVTGALSEGLVLERDGSGAELRGELGRIAGSYLLELSARSPLGAATTTVLLSVTGPPASSATPWLEVTTLGAPFNLTVEDYPGPGVTISVAALVAGLHAHLGATGVVITGAGLVAGELGDTVISERRGELRVLVAHLEVLVAGTLSS